MRGRGARDDDRRQPVIVEVSAHYPPFLGGLESVVQIVAEQLAARGRAVRVVTGDGGAADPVEPERANPLVVRHRSVEVGGLPVIPGMVGDLFRLRPPAVLHVHVSQAGIPEVALLAGRLRRWPVVLHFHLDVEPSGPFGSIFALYKRLVLPRALRAAARVIVFSEAQAGTVGAKYGVRRDRLAVIPNGIRPMDGARRPRSFARPQRVLFVGRLAQQKRVSTLLRAVAAIDGDVAPELRVVGSGPLGGELRDEATSLGVTSVTFDGALEGDALIDAFRWADLFVLPSDGEGMPLAMLEAMSAGLVVVGSDVTGIRDFIVDGENGVLFPLGDHVRLAEHLRGLAEDGDRCRRLAAAATASVSELTWGATTERLLAVLDEASAVTR